MLALCSPFCQGRVESSRNQYGRGWGGGDGDGDGDRAGIGVDVSYGLPKYEAVNIVSPCRHLRPSKTYSLDEYSPGRG